MSADPNARRQQLQDPVGRWRRICEIRLVEERIQSLYSEGAIRGSTHLANGQEAVAVGLASALRTTDTVACTYRGHAVALALGMPAQALFGELCGRVSGSARGVGGSMHLADKSIGLLPSFAIVGAGLPVAVGAGLAAQNRGTDDVAVSVCGDGATNIGAFHESLNLASVWGLPVVFIVENNLYGEYSPIRRTTPLDDLAERAAAYAMPGHVVDGQDVDAVRAAVEQAVAHGRAGGGPTLLEMKTYRYSGHSRSDPAAYRPAGELDAWLERDPVNLAGDRLVELGLATREERESWAAELRAGVDEAAEAALASPAPDIGELLSHVTA